MNTRNVQRGLKLLDNAQANILGVVLNKMDTGHGSYYSYKYKYSSYYSEDRGSKSEKNKTNLVFKEVDV